MLALPPILPPASTVYSVANEQAFRVALLRYFQQQRTDATVVDPGQAPSALNGTLVKSVGGGALGNTMVTEASGVLLVSEALRVTGATILAAALSVAGAANFDSTVNATGAIASTSTVQGTRLISTIATGTAPLTVASTTVVTNLNADLLDGQTGTYYTDPTNLTGFGAAGGYLRSTGSAWARVGIASILTDLLTVDGAGSGLDADLLDGQHGAFYQDAGNLNAGTLLSARLTGAYGGITGIGTLASGAVPASLVTAGTFGAGDYVFPANLTVTTLLTVGGGAVADTSGSVLLKNASGGVDFAGGPFRITRAVSAPTASLRSAGGTGTVAAPVVPVSGHLLGGFSFQGWDGTSAYAEQAAVQAQAAELWSTGGPARGTRLLFKVTPNASGASEITPFVVDHDGMLTPLAASTNTYDLGRTTATIRSGYFGTSVTSPVYDTAATDSLLKRAGATMLTLGATSATFSKGDLTLVPVSSEVMVHTNTVDGADTAALYLTPGSAHSNTRGALLQLFGNEHANTGQLIMTSGNVAGNSVIIQGAGTTVATLTGGLLAVTGAGTFTTTVSATQLTSTVAIGTAPFVVTSTTLVANLHADTSDKLGGTVAASYALLASPTFTGVPLAPTAAPGTNTTQIASTAFVTAAGAALTVPLSQVTAGTSPAGTFIFPTLAGTVRVTSPLFGTTTAADVVFDRNSVTQLTLSSLLATFAGSATITTALNFGASVASSGTMRAGTTFNLSALSSTTTVSLFDWASGPDLTVGSAANVRNVLVIAGTGSVSLIAGAAQIVADTPTSSISLAGTVNSTGTIKAPQFQASYAPGSITLATGKFLVQVKRLQLTGTQRLAVAGTARYTGIN